MERTRTPDGVEIVAVSSVKETSVTSSFSSPTAKITCRFPTDRIARRPVSEDTIPTSCVSVSYGTGSSRPRRSAPSFGDAAAGGAAFDCSRAGCSGKK